MKQKQTPAKAAAQPVQLDTIRVILVSDRPFRRHFHRLLKEHHYPGSALLDTKTNEIPVARELFGDLELTDRRVSLDALHNQTETVVDLVLEHGAHYLLTVKDNQPTLRQKSHAKFPCHRRVLPPSGPNGKRCAHGGKEQGEKGEQHPGKPPPVFPEDIGFSFAAQIALLTRQRQGRKTETVGLITGLPS